MVGGLHGKEKRIHKPEVEIRQISKKICVHFFFDLEIISLQAILCEERIHNNISTNARLEQWEQRRMHLCKRK